jgi:deoxyribose-phosphate aldolase
LTEGYEELCSILIKEGEMPAITKQKLASMIDHSEVRQDSTEEEVRLRCEEAKKYRFASLYVCPCYIQLAKELLEGSGIPLGTAIAFPHGATTTEVKVFEAREAIRLGADILDIVMNIGMLKSGKTDYVKRDLVEVVKASKKEKADVILKVIIETGSLNNDQIVTASQIVKEAGAHFVKTSTGFLAADPTFEDVQLIRESVGKDFGVKVAGGVKTADKALKMIEAGVDLIGETAGVSLVEGLDFIVSLMKK